ncbi:MAG: MaoC family dehydratase N-terminal domain-containing protein [Chloroflexi bacterium]|nr:MaoC family dehydratase N-terminal domain-containing protein [Chloroflexota bacterium]
MTEEQPKPPVIPQEVLNAVIGVESRPMTHVVEKGAVLRFVRAVNDDGPRFYGDSEPGNAHPDDMVAPPTFLCSLFSGIREVEWDNPFDGLLDGSVDWEFFEPVRAGDRITVTSKIADIMEKDGKLGTMLFVTTEFRYVNQNDALAAIQRNTLIWYDPQVAHELAQIPPGQSRLL